MTIEKIERTLQTVAENQAKHDEMHVRHSAHMAEIDEHLKQIAAMQAQHTVDMAEIDKLIAALVRSQNRYDERLGQITEIIHDLADKQLKNEELFAELAGERVRHEARMAQLEASYELFETFVKEHRESRLHYSMGVSIRLAHV